MYLEKVKGNVVYLALGNESDNPRDLLRTKRYKLTQLAEFLGAKEVRVLNSTDEIRSNVIILDYYDSLKSNWHKEACALCISVYWCDLNEALVLEEIWETTKVGHLIKTGENSAKLNDVLEKEEYSFFEIGLTCRDFTRHGAYETGEYE
jgi:hypothetical protein